MAEFSFETGYAMKHSFFYLFFCGIVLLELIGGAMGQLNPFLTDLHGAEFMATFVSLNSLLASIFWAG